MKNILSISSLSIGYDKNNVLSNINVVVDQPKLITLIGRNGQGKSTLLKTLTGLIPAMDGEIFFGEKINKDLSHKEKSKLFSVVLTSPPAINNITVKDFVAYGRYPYTNWLAVKKEEDNWQINQAMELCGITNFAATNIANLSDGERQKVALARAIAQNTPIIFLDEPTSHLDLVNQSDFGLGVSIFTENDSKIEKLIPLFEDGAVFVNELVKSDPRLPFGGTKISGYGRELSEDGIKEFVNKKTVYIK